MKPEPNVPELYLEKQVLGEMPRQSDPDSTKRIEELLRSNQEILSTYPPDLMAHRISEKITRETQGRRRQTRLRLALAAAPVFTILLLTGWMLGLFNPNSPDSSVKEDVRIKGNPRLIIHRNQRGSVEQLSHGDNVKTGDLLQIGYVASGARHGVILSVDGRGQVTLHYPENASGDTRLEQKDLVNLSFSYQLDDAPGFERFFLATSTHPIDVDKVVRAAAKLGARRQQHLQLSSGVQYQEIILNKTSGARQ